MRSDHVPRARLANGFLLLVLLTWALIVLGALVRVNDAGLACPDWPLCFGEVLPRMNLRVAFEVGHRFAAGGIASCFAALAVVALRREETRRAVRTPIAIAGVLLTTQVLLGAFTVWLQLASWTVTAHLLTGNLFAAALLWIALTLRDPDRSGGESPRPGAGTRAAVGVGVLLLALQMLLGGLVASRYVGLACTSWPDCQGGVWFPSFEGALGIHLVHRWNAALLLAALGVAAWAARETPGLRAAARLALALGVLQFGVGIANVLLGLAAEVTGLHSALAAALVLAMTACVRACSARGGASAPMLQSQR